MTTEVTGKGKMEIEWLNVGGPEPIPPEESEKNGTRPKGLENPTEPEWEGKIPLYIGLRNTSLRIIFCTFYICSRRMRRRRSSKADIS